MNRNVESHFSIAPADVSMQRSRFDRSHDVKTSFNVGDLVPFYIDEVLPGDTFVVDTSKVVRLQTLITPIMDNIYLDTYYFFVPSRLTWEHWKEFMGENTQSAWVPQAEYTVPQLVSPTGGWNVGTIADYLGIATGIDDLSVSALPFRAYALICNEWFRDQNLTDPLNIPLGDVDATGSNGSSYVTDVALGGAPFRVAKYHDYFTSGLPAPQKGPDVLIPQGTAGQIPVYSLADAVPTNSNAVTMRFDSRLGSSGEFTETWGYWHNSQTLGLDSENEGSRGSVVPLNLWAVGSGAAAGATINQLRLAFQIQKLYERDARSGSRYIEILKSHFGVTSPDSRLQRPEYLGGNRIPITIAQVIQQSGTMTGSTPQGNTAAMSLTTDVHSDFTQSFTEHGYIIGVMAARYHHTYQQGVNSMFFRRGRFDYYWPVLANIGEQPIYNREIYAQGSGVVNSDTGKPYDEEVFAYQEAWASYRYKPSIVTGQMRSSYAQSLDAWHLADKYSSMPYLSDAWIREDPANVDRALAVQSSVSNQFFADIFVKAIATRVMPAYSVPGLIDHH